ncbi:hypothetical protein EMCRGX_G035013 [Ephydatia muelleri]|eukprot:Em0023g923a
MTALPAKALCNIGTFCGGECRISLTDSAITISDTNGVELGSWSYNAIRQFRGDDAAFSFTSGRRGPFGVGNYDFFLAPLYLSELKSTLTKYTGAQFGTEKSPEHIIDGAGPQRVPISTAQPRYVLHGLDTDSIGDQPHYAGGIVVSVNRLPFVMHDGNGFETGFSQQRNSLSALNNQYESNRPTIKKQITLQEPHSDHSYHLHSEVEIPVGHVGSISDQQKATYKKVDRNRPYVEIDPICPDNRPSGINQQSAAAVSSYKVSSEPLNTTVEPYIDDGSSSTLDFSVRNRILKKETSISDSRNPVDCGKSVMDAQIYDKLPPRADTYMYDSPHSSIYSIPRFSESTSPPPTLNTRQGQLSSSAHSIHSGTLTKRPLPSTPIEIEQQFTSSLNNTSNSTNSGYVDIDIQERTNGDVYFQIKNPSEPSIVTGDKIYAVSPSMQSPQLARFKLTPDVSSDSIAHKLASEGYELVTVAQQGLQSTMRSDKKLDELSLHNGMDALHLSENAKVIEGDDDPEGYIVVRSLRPTLPPEQAAYENVVNSNQERTELNEDEEYATIHHLERESSENGLYETIQVASNQFMPLSVPGTTNTVQKPLEKILVPISTESTTTAQLRFRGRTVGDILDVDKHTYVNIKCEDDCTVLRKGGNTLPTKKPKPAPRNSSSSRLGNTTDRESAQFDETL